LQHAFFLFQLDDSFFCRHALTLRPLAPFGKLLGNLSSYNIFMYKNVPKGEEVKTITKREE